MLRVVVVVEGVQAQAITPLEPRNLVTGFLAKLCDAIWLALVAVARAASRSKVIIAMGFIEPSLLQQRTKMMQPDGTIRFMGRYWFRDPWRQSHLEGDDWDD